MAGPYPADTAAAGLRLFLAWFGAFYARSASVADTVSGDGLLTATVTVGRQWRLAVTVADTLAAATDVEFEMARAAVEQRIDAAGRSIALWPPRGARLPAGEPGLSELMLSLEGANVLDDGRLEVRRSANLYLRRTGATGSVITVLGGLGAHWAQFTNRVPGTFQLNSMELLRLPHSQGERDALAERIVMAAGQPEVDDTVVVPAEDAWTANDLREGGSCVLGTPRPESDDQSASLRRDLRQLLRAARDRTDRSADARALVVLGAADYAADEKLSWALRGMDPGLYGGFELLTVVADGIVRPLLQPGRSTLPWDAPMPGQPA